MKSFKDIYVAFLLVLIPFTGICQQTPQFSQYMYNTISINPAYAGSREYMVINVLNRNQWVGINGAPETQTLSAHTSIPKSNVGVGLSVINDKLGYERMTYVYSDFSYRIDLDGYDEYKLTFGLKAGFRKYSLDEDLLNDPEYNNDPELANVDYKWDPNFGVGVYFRGDSFYLGLSAPKIFRYKNNTEYFSLDRMSYFLNGGYLFDVDRHIKIKPAFIVKYTDGAPISVDISSMMLINENLWIGANYRLGDSLGALVNFKLTEGFSVGYAYDYITSNLNFATAGSHEIMLNYEFEFPKPRCICKNLYN
jgi:type IX secretion system PorP/SprF family membrane protein